MYVCMYICRRLKKGSRQGREGKERKDTYEGWSRKKGIGECRGRM